MTEAEAIKRLAFHTHPGDEAGHTEPGFVAMLRPFRGKLYEKNYQELIAVIEILKGDLQPPGVDKEIISDLWFLVHCTRVWAIDEESMLRRNKLISDEQVATLREWINTISEKVMFLLETDVPR